MKNTSQITGKSNPAFAPAMKTPTAESMIAGIRKINLFDSSGPFQQSINQLFQVHQSCVTELLKCCNSYLPMYRYPGYYTACC